MPLIRRAGVGDAALLLTLIREFYEVDRHPYDEHRVVRAIGPLLVDDSVGQVWLITSPPGQGGGVTGVTVQVVAGIQTLSLVSSVRTSKGRRPCLAAVDR